MSNRNRPQPPGTRTLEVSVDRGGLRAMPANIALACVVAKLEAKGELVLITQADIDAIAGRMLVESLGDDGLLLTIGDKVRLDG